MARLVVSVCFAIGSVVIANTFLNGKQQPTVTCRLFPPQLLSPVLLVFCAKGSYIRVIVATESLTSDGWLRYIERVSSVLEYK